ncbi:Uma2 family endonuclease [soil metagenome]
MTMTLEDQAFEDRAFTTHKFSLETYNRMIEAEILTKQDKVELIRGEIVAMAPRGNKHLFLTNYYADRLLETYRGEAWVVSQSPVQLQPNSEPEPDLTLLKLPIDRYKERKPQAEDILLIVEVSDSTLLYDRGKKLRLYAKADIPEVWISNLQDNVLEAYREPKGGRYCVHLTFLEGEDVTPLFSDKPFSWS